MVSINKKRTYLEDFAVLANHRMKLKESKKRKQIPRPWSRTEKVFEHEGDGDTNLSKNWGSGDQKKN